MKIELTKELTLEITEDYTVKINGKEIYKVKQEPEEFFFLTPDGRKFTITEDQVIEAAIAIPSLKPPTPLDLTELLKGYEGNKFWSPCWGECEFLEIHNRDGGRPSLKFRTKNGECRNVTPRGCLGYNYERCGGECIIWPSKDNQTWNRFGKEIWVVKKTTGELYLYVGHPKYGKLYITTMEHKNLLKFLTPGKPLLIVQ